MNENDNSDEVSLGRLLKKARVEKGLTLAQVSEKTKIGIRWLEAAEDDRFDELPGILFSKGLVRTYESLTGIKNGGLLKKFEAMEITVKGNEPKLIEDMPLHRESNVARIVWIVLCLVAVCATALVYYFFGNIDSEPVGGVVLKQYATGKKDHKPARRIEPDTKVEKPADTVPETSPAEEISGEPAPAEPVSTEEPSSGEPPRTEEPVPATPPEETDAPPVAPSPPEAEPTEPAVKEEKAVEPVEKPAEPAPNETKTDLDRLADRSKPLALSITASSDSWLKVLVDGEIEREIILRAGKKVIWSADRSYKLSIGNVAGVSLALNGVAIKLKQPASNIITNLKLPIAVPDKTAGEGSNMEREQ